MGYSDSYKWLQTIGFLSQVNIRDKDIIDNDGSIDNSSTVILMKILLIRIVIMIIIKKKK